MRKITFIALAVILASVMSAPLFAHHGAASIASDKEVTLKGTVTKWIYTNPHLLLQLDVTGEDGKVVHWILESQSPTVMYPSGYRKDSFHPGDVVTVTARPAKNGQPVGAILEATTANGTKLSRYRPQTGAEQ